MRREDSFLKMLMPLKLDVLAFAAHPDDVELSVGGTMVLLAWQGYKTGIVDFTRGQLGSRGTPELREQEAAESAKILKLSARHNLGLADGNIINTPETRLPLIRLIRRYRPHIALINAPDCRHPDHPAAAKFAADALFYSGLRMIETEDDGEPQEPWRPHHVLHYMQSISFEPSLIVDVSDVWEERLASIAAFKSQFHNPDYEPSADEPQTFVSNPEFFKWLEARARSYGYRIGAEYGEPFLYRHGPPGVKDLVAAFQDEKAFR